MAASKIRGKSVPGKSRPKKTISTRKVKTIVSSGEKKLNRGTMFHHVVPQPVEKEEIKKKNKNASLSIGPVVKSKKNLDGSGAIVGILDTGVFEHNDLKGKIIERMSFDGSKRDVEDKQGHGTHIAGIIAGSRSKTDDSICGIAPGARIVSIKITSGDKDETSLWRIADGLEQISKYNSKNKKNKITAIVICYNAFDNVGKSVVTQHHRLSKLVNQFHSDNIPVICSGGNNYDFFKAEGLAYPAYIQNIIACGAMYNVPEGDHKVGEYTEFAQRIAPNNKIFGNYFLWARGYHTISTGITSKTSYTEMSGSSQAAAVIAGSILLLQQSEFGKSGNLPSIDKLVVEIKNQN